MSKILVVSGHTDLKNSVANLAILDKLEQEVPNVEIDRLCELYPDYKINIESEQKKLIDADIIILQYPIFWYSTPSLLERWMEETFSHGFAHGSTGDKLRGKKMIVSFTTGAPENYYVGDAAGYKTEYLLRPIKSACAMCGIEFRGFVATYGVSYQIRTGRNQAIIEKTKDHVKKLMELI